MGNQQERSLAWLAGIIDGEGTVSFQVYTKPDGRVRITPYVCVVNTDAGILAEVFRIMTELTEHSTEAKPRWCTTIASRLPGAFASVLPCKNLRLDGRAVRFVLVPLLPYLKSKKLEAAQVVLRYLALRDQMIFKRDARGRLERQGYTEEQVALVASIRLSKRAKSSEAIRRAPNILRVG